MKITKLMYLYRKQNKGNLFRSLVLIAMFSVAIVFIQLAILDTENSYYGIRIAEQIMQERDRLYNVRLDTPEISDDIMLRLKEFTDELSTIDEVTASGRYYTASIIFEQLDNDEDFLEMNRQLREGTMVAEYPEILDITYLDASLLPYFSMKEIPKGKKNTIPVMVGYAYKEYLKSGDIFKDKESGNQYEVVGVLPKDSIMPSDNLFQSEELYRDMNTMLFAAYEDGVDKYNGYITNYTNSIYFVTDGNTECIEKVKQLAANKNLRIKMDSVSGYIEENKVEHRVGMELTLLFTAMAVICGFTAMVSTSIIRVILKKQQYGILYANGVSYRDTANLIALDHGMKMFIAFVLATLISWGYLVKFTMAGLKDLQALLFGRVLWEAMLFVFLIFVISVLIPVRLLKRLDVTELLGGNEL